MCVALGHLNGRVAHPLHGRSYVHTGAQQARTTGMPEHVDDELFMGPQSNGIAHLDPVAIEPAFSYVAKGDNNPRHHLHRDHHGSLHSTGDLPDAAGNLTCKNIFKESDILAFDGLVGLPTHRCR